MSFAHNNTGNPPDLLTEADGYTHKQAALLYVHHLEGLPTLEKNCLLVGPLGSGKTIMLKAIYSKYETSNSIFPVFVELSRWMSLISGETHTYTQDHISPRGTALLDAMSLSIILGLCVSAGALNEDNHFPELWSLFPSEITSLPHAERQSFITRSIKNTLTTGDPFSMDLPSVHAVACALGRDTRQKDGRKLVILVDQIDQVASQFFPPLANLLKRSGDYISILATRPCPTAPDAEVTPSDVISGDSYGVLHLGRSSKGEIPYGFVRDFIHALPLDEAFREAIADRSTLIGNFMWPSLRSAISVIVRYKLFRSQGVAADEAWYKSLIDTAKGYEALLKDGLRAWGSPTSMLKDWRDRIFKERAQIGRSYFVLPTDLVGDVKGKGPQRLLRMLLKNGVFLLGPEEQYTPGSIPRVCEVAPLLLVNTPRVDLDHFVTQPATIVITQKAMDKWCQTTGGFPTQRRKSVFVSCKGAQDPDKKTPLQEIIERKFKSSIEVVTGALPGSPPWSPRILEMISRSDLMLCDLSVPRRNVFVEYGIAIGAHIPVIQCRSTESTDRYPAWITSRQVQTYRTDLKENYKLENSVSYSLNSETDLKSSWRRDSTGKKLDVAAKRNVVAFIAPTPSNNLYSRLDAIAREEDFDLRFLELQDNRDDLESIIRMARSAGTLIAVFNHTATDYLTCIAGGIFVTGRITGKASMFLLGLHDDAIPSQLSNHPSAYTCRDESDLLSMFLARLAELKGRPQERTRARK